MSTKHVSLPSNAFESDTSITEHRFMTDTSTTLTILPESSDTSETRVKLEPDTPSLGLVA